MTIVDSVLILFLLAGAVLGFKKGAIKSLVAFVGTLLVVIISYYLKDYVASFLFNFVPFVNFSGSWMGLVTLNILVYEAISYVIVFVLLNTILQLALKISGIIETILKATIILGIPSKLIGAVLGFLEALVFSFLVLFILVQINSTSEFIMDSSIATSILDKTPLMGNITKDTYKAIKDINNLQDKYHNSNKDEYNKEILSIMLEYKVISPKDTEKLIENKKLNFSGAKDALDKYKESVKND